MQTLGWIGLGNMGTPMAKNLLQAGFKVNVYNRSPEKARNLVDSGAVKLQSPQEVVRQSDITFLMLSNGAAVKEVLTAENGVTKGLTPGKVIIDMSTISPVDSLAFTGLVAEKGGVYVDAPVSGSVGAAEAAQLIILAGGEEKDIAAYQPCFQSLGKKTIAFGATGNGSSAKLAINLLLGITGQAVAETLLFAEKSGLDRETVMEMISNSGMNTGWFQAKKEMFRKEQFPSAFMLELMSKDLGLIGAEAERLQLNLPLAETTGSTYLAAKENGLAKQDMAAVFLLLKEKNGL